MKVAESGSRGVFWRPHERGSQGRKRNDGTKERGDWWIRWKCRYGHLHRAPVGAKSRAVKKVERRRVKRTCPRRAPRPSSHLLADVIDEYLANVKGQKRSYRDDKRYGEVWKARFGSRTLEDVTSADLEKVKAERLEKVKPSTVNRELAFLKHVYNVAIRDGKTERSPFTRLRLLQKASGRVRYLTDEEEAELLKKLPTESDRDRLRVLVQTGLRKSEFLGLRWRDVDFKAGVLTIPRSKNGETRHVPMTSEVRAIVTHLPRPLNSLGLVFPNSVGGVDLRWAEKTFPGAVSAAGIEDFRLHDTRHTFASRLAVEGVDLLTIKDLGGWKSLAMVQRYAHLSPSHRRQAIERLVTRATPTGQAASAQAQ
jgi:integrase